ncbi:MAG: type II toxin-antitoxin system HicA family toxin [Dehalococcoidia bacterium]
MSRLPRISAEEAIRALTAAGFQPLRQRGSHVFLKHTDGRATVVPVHRGEDLGPGILSKILRDTELSREDFIRLVRG